MKEKCKNRGLRKTEKDIKRKEAQKTETTEGIKEGTHKDGDRNRSRSG